MWINTYVAVLASLAAITAATYVGYPYANPISTYSGDLYPFDYSSPVLADPYNFYSSGHAPNHIGVYPSYYKSQFHQPSEQFRGFAYHTDFKGGSTSNVLFLTGHGTGFPTFYPGSDIPTVGVAGKKAAVKPVDKDVAVKKVDTKTKDLCDTFQDTFGKGVHNFYSLDNGPLFIKPGFDFNYLPSLPSWPYGFENFGPVYTEKPKIPVDDSKKVDDDTVAIERKITVKIPGAEKSVPETTSESTESNDAKPIDSTPAAEPPADNSGAEDEDTRTISPLLPSSSEEPLTSATLQPDAGETTTVDNQKKKRQSVRVRLLRKL